MKHTSTPWTTARTGEVMRRSYSQSHGIVELNSANLIAGLFFDVRGGEPVAEANAKRIVECVNALEGIENPKEFVDQAGIDKLAKEIAKKALIENTNQLRARVAALEDGLKELFEAAKHCDPLFENRWSKASEKAKSLLK